MSCVSMRGSKESRAESVSASSSTRGLPRDARTAPSPEKPRDLAGLSPTLRRAPGKRATHREATGSLSASTSGP